MIRRPGPFGRRPGLSLLEVLVALAVFLISLGAITQLVTLAGNRALDAQRRSEATRLCQSKLSEVVAGAVPLSGQNEAPFEEDPDYTWSLTTDSGSVTGLWVVTVTVARKGSDDPADGCVLRQLVLDPAQRGSTQDTVTIAGSDSTATGSASASPTQASTPSPSPSPSPSTSPGRPSSSTGSPAPGGGRTPSGGRPPAGSGSAPTSTTPSKSAPAAPAKGPSSGKSSSSGPAKGG